MDMQLCDLQRHPGVIRQGPCQVRMAAMMILPTRQQIMGIGVATRADHIMHPATKAVKTIPIQTVIGDQRHLSQIGQV